MSLRIVHCSNFNCVRLKGCYLSSMGYKLNNGLSRLGHQVITYSDRDMARLFGIFGKKTFLSYSYNNENFYKFCLNIKPDIIFLGHADTISTSTIAKIREKLPNIKVLQWSVDSINGKLEIGKRNIKHIKSKLSVVDYTLITTGDKKLYEVFNPKKNKIGFIPNPIDRSIEKGKAFEIEKPQYDLFYATSPQSLRDFCGEICFTTDVFSYLEKACPKMNLLFPGVNSSPVNGTEYMEKLSQSAMVLNLSRVNDYWYSSDRMAHAMGNGCLTLIDRNTGFDELFSDCEAVFYNQKEELADKINYFTTHPKARMEIAKNGWIKAYELFNEVKIAQYCLDMLEGTANQSEYPFYVEL